MTNLCFWALPAAGLITRCAMFQFCFSCLKEASAPCLPMIFSEMEIVGAQEKQVDSSFSYFSLISLGGTAQGVTVTGAKYPLCDAQIKCDYQYGVSNEVSAAFPQG